MVGVLRGTGRLHATALATLLAMAAAGSYGQPATLVDDAGSQSPEERRRKLTKAEKKRAKRQARNLRLATHHQEPKDGDDA